MEIEMSAEAKDKRLNQLVAVTVLLLSVFTGLCNIKDGNVVQGMEQAEADSVDRWNEYQATRTKLHISETALGQVQALTAPSGPDHAADYRAGLADSIAKYKRETPGLRRQAVALSAKYDALNVHDDQFDASDALISTAISMAAVAALVESFWLIAAAWVFGGFGIFMGLCGFAGWAFHPDVLSNFLG